MIELEKLIDVTLKNIRDVCEEKKKPCVAFSLLFLDPVSEKEKQWEFSIGFVGDKRIDKHTEEDKERLELAFMYIQEGVKRIMAGEFAKSPEVLH